MRAISIRDDSACADVVGDIAGGIGEADDRLRADVGDHAVKTFSALLVEQFLSEALPNGHVRLNNFLVERRNHDEVIAGVRLDRRTDHSWLEGMNDCVDFGDDQILAIGAEIAPFRFRFAVDGIALRKLGEVPPLVDLLFEIFRGRNIGQQHLRHSYFQWRQEFVGMLFVEGVQFLLREFDLGFDPILEELVENQLFPVALRSIADGIVLVESLACALPA